MSDAARPLNLKSAGQRVSLPVALVGFAVLSVVLSKLFPPLDDWPAEWLVPVRVWVTEFFVWFSAFASFFSESRTGR